MRAAPEDLREVLALLADRLYREAWTDNGPTKDPLTQTMRDVADYDAARLARDTPRERPLERPLHVY